MIKRIFLAVFAAFCLIPFSGCGDSDTSSGAYNDSFLAGGIWETVIYTNEEKDDGYVIAYQFDEDSRYYLYRNLVVISQGTYEVDEGSQKLTFYSSDGSQEWSADYEYDEGTSSMKLEADIPVEVTEAADSSTDAESSESDESSETATEIQRQYMILSKLSEEDASYYDTENEEKVIFEKVTDTDEEDE